MLGCRYGITAPSIHAMPTDHHADRLFNPGNRDTIFHGSHARFDLMTRLLWAVEGNPLCSDHCERQLLSIVTCHLKSRGLRHLRAAAGVVRALSELYNAFLVVKGEQVHFVQTAGLERGDNLPANLSCNDSHGLPSTQADGSCCSSMEECCHIKHEEALLVPGPKPAAMALSSASSEQST